ncbi:MAG: hypothetical protein HYX62_07210 [Gammaproteobacteria bacterium]|nr:hypothetical protein [Gammaproteobacteria bacterium]
MGGSLGEWLAQRIWCRLAPFDLIEHVATVSDSVEIGARIYTIRPFLASDMEQILPLARRLYEEEMAHVTGGGINEAMLAKLERNAEEIRSAFTVLAGTKVCGFVRYLCWTNALRQEKILENIYVYVAPENRSFTLFRRIVRLFERAGREFGVDRILFSFETGSSPEIKRVAMERMGFSRLGAYLAKRVETENKRQTVVTKRPRSRPTLAAVRYLRPATRLGRGDFFLYLFGSYLQVRDGIDRDQSFFELTGADDSYLMARTMTRVFDRQKLAVVIGVSHPTPEMVHTLDAWAIHERCVAILVNTKETLGDACDLFGDYARHEFSVMGHIMSKHLTAEAAP